MQALFVSTMRLMEPKRPRGQPRKPDPASVRINVRVTPGEREAYKAKARKAKAPSLSAWLKGLAERE